MGRKVAADTVRLTSFASRARLNHVELTGDETAPVVDEFLRLLEEKGVDILEHHREGRFEGTLCAIADEALAQKGTLLAKPREPKPELDPVQAKAKKEEEKKKRKDTETVEDKEAKSAAKRSKKEPKEPKEPKEKKETKETKEAKEPKEKKKRPMTGFMVFSLEMRTKFKESPESVPELKDVSFGEAGKIIGAKWKDISAEDKEAYKQRGLAEFNKKQAENASSDEAATNEAVVDEEQPVDEQLDEPCEIKTDEPMTDEATKVETTKDEVTKDEVTKDDEPMQDTTEKDTSETAKDATEPTPASESARAEIEEAD